MNVRKQVSPVMIAAAVAMALGLTVGSGAAAAGERGQNAQRPAARQSQPMPRGDYTRHTERQRTENGHVRRDTWQGENGRTASRSATVANDKDAGVRTRDVEWVGPNGQTAARHDVTTRTENGYTRDSTFVGPQGQTTTRQASVVNDKDAGTRTRDAVTTLPDGRTRTLNDVVTRTENGYSRDTTITNPNGGTVQRDVEASYDPESRTWSRDISVDRTPAPAEPAGG